MGEIGRKILNSTEVHGREIEEERVIKSNEKQSRGSLVEGEIRGTN